MLKRFVLPALFFAGASAALAAQSVRVPSETPVSVQATVPVSSKTARVGDTVPLKVTEDVIVNGYVVIAHGAEGKAVVDSVQPAQMNSAPGALRVTYKWVRAVDGSKIGVNGIFSAQGPNASFGETQAQLNNAASTARDQNLPQATTAINRITNVFIHAKTASTGGEALLDPGRAYEVGVHTNGVPILSNQRASVTTSKNDADVR
jgi:hypothetical protein